MTVEEGDVPTSKNERIENHREYDPYELIVKPDYILKERPECLGPIPEDREERIDRCGQPNQQQEGEENNPDETNQDGNNGKNNNDDDNHNMSKNKKRNDYKNKNKKKSKRARDERQEDADKMCMAIIQGLPCPYGEEKCRFSHDIKSFLATRPEDIKELQIGCPIFNTYGYCAYGISCRFGSSHITKTGENIRNEQHHYQQQQQQADIKGQSSNDQESPPLDYEPGLNLLLPKEAQHQLRKRTFPFKTKAHFEKNSPTRKEPSNISPAETTQGSSTDQPPPTTTVVSSGTPIELATRKKIVDFNNKIYIAPLTTVGNLPFRRIMKRFGADITCGEMAVGTCLLEGRQSEWALLKRHPEEDVFGVQIAAAHPDQFTRVSELVEEFVQPDFVDLNLGCPLDLLCNKGAGAALMLREKKLKGALMGITAVLSCPVTIKMRTGWDMNDPFAHKLAGKIQSWQLDGIGAIMVGAHILHHQLVIFLACQL